ncbi:MAG: hypothetical protein IIB88_07620 [Chloroflexi bacterium]|nr:hypothetical protein [Chloroflexota bacterium]
MRWLLSAATVAAALGIVSAGAQAAITADVTLAPPRVTVGDRITLTITVEHDTEVAVSAPDAHEAFEPLDLIEVLPPETRDVGGGRMESVFSFELSAFLIGEIELKPIAITADGLEVLHVQPEAIFVESVVLPDAAPDMAAQLRGLKAPLEAGTGPPKWIWAALFMAGFAAVSVFTMGLARVPTLRAPSASKPAPSPPEQSPDDAALEVFDQIADSLLLDKGELSEYYRRIGESLRGYIAHRFGVPASAMTPRELEERLEATSMSKLAARQAVATLEQCQSVQFAGYVPARERAEADLMAAAEIVRLTSEAEGAEVTEG